MDHPVKDIQEPKFSVVPQFVRGEEHISSYVHSPVRMPSSRIREISIHSPVRDHPEQPDTLDVPNEQSGIKEPPKEPPQESLPKPTMQNFEPPKAEWDASR